MAFLGFTLGACSSTDAPADSPPDAESAGSASQAGSAPGAGSAGSAGSSAERPGGSASAGAVNAAGGAASSAAGAGSGASGRTGAGGTAVGGSNQGGSSAAGAATGGEAGGTCPVNAQVCLDFESGTYPGWTKNGSTLAVDATRPWHGAQALHISVPVNGAGGMLEFRGAPLFPLPQKQVWGRMMIYFEGVPDGHTDLANAKGQGAATYNVGEQHDSIMLNYYAGSRATDCWARPKPEKKVPDKTWMCWEWMFDSAKNHVDFWMDGTLLRSVNGTGDGCLQGNGVWQAPAEFEVIGVGEHIAERSSTTAYQAWIDDVALSNTGRVGCPGTE
jgi:hypothetical protein